LQCCNCCSCGATSNRYFVLTGLDLTARRPTRSAAPAIAEARKHTIEALDVLVQIMLNEKAPPNARVAAANTLLDRAYGRPAQFSTSDAEQFRKAVDLSDDELATIAAKANVIPLRPVK
jgi:hypothetical protein